MIGRGSDWGGGGDMDQQRPLCLSLGVAILGLAGGPIKYFHPSQLNSSSCRPAYVLLLVIICVRFLVEMRTKAVWVGGLRNQSLNKQTQYAKQISSP